LGNAIPGVDKYLLPIIAIIIIASVIPSVLHIIKERKTDSEIKEALEEVREEVETIVKK